MVILVIVLFAFMWHTCVNDMLRTMHYRSKGDNYDSDNENVKGE